MSEFLCAVFQVLVKGNIGVVDVPYYEFVEMGRQASVQFLGDSVVLQ